mmetsp:Transcript_22588/g.35336  ORF Transcript_22588/g.35336 Transcript_22588/m.35336 type:complete len:91 (+) Transcript_22588:108-380(+)|eukprot:CAMPEP_0184324820 /NCGR_PEP_ID=MMETSP1049-20130417/137113_1 /TAXON_ID=77928 /ORGANISM="Proteomonas sulcata, Strain CCMP704" /LENGTH=90 /DNA_ID=CAMNT_0026646689 /DNA_START=103 /DNA_END=375 /DNA_ORIENTATION=+
MDSMYAHYPSGHSSKQEAYKAPPGMNYNCEPGHGGCKRWVSFAGKSFGDFKTFQYPDKQHIYGHGKESYKFPHSGRASWLPDPDASWLPK